MTATLESSLSTYRRTDEVGRPPGGDLPKDPHEASSTSRPNVALSEVAPRFTARLYLLQNEGWGLVVDYTEPIGRWLEEVVAPRAFYLLDLPEGWDSYGARRIDPDAVAEGLQLLLEVIGASEDIQIPHLTPGPNGEVQLGWYRGGKTLEVDIAGPGDATVYFCDEDADGADSEWELDLVDVRPRLPALVRQHFSPR
jgi:hypothetical protein